MRIPKSLRKTPLLLALVATIAYAGESASSLISAGMNADCADFAAKVSASEGNFGTSNQFGCLGAFQFCPGTFEHYYSGSASSFLNDPSAQVAAWTKYEQNGWSAAQHNNLTSILGQQVCYNGQCGTVSQSSILMACQFGCGAGGKLANYVASGDCNARNVKDGNGVSVCSYLMRGAGYNVSCFTKGSPDCAPNESVPATPAAGPADITASA